MLREIRIRGLGVIDDATVPLGRGLNVLTGETGAGKTMVVSALGLLLGRRAEAGRVREQAAKAAVEGIVDLPEQHPARARALEAGADAEDDLILARTVAESGRSRAVVGGRTVPVSVLAELGEMLVAVHGQSDQWRLQRPEQHRVMLDSFAGGPVADARADYERDLRRWRDAERELQDLQTRQRERAQRLAALTAGLEEIERLDPQPGEDGALRAEAERLGNVDDLSGAAQAAGVAMSGDPDDPSGTTSVVDLIAAARAALQVVEDVDPQVGQLQGRLRELAVLAADVSADLASYRSGLDADPGRLEEINQRRAVLTDLMRRYGDTIEDVLAWSAAAAVETADLAGTDDRIDALRAVVDELGPQVGQAAARLSDARTDAAGRMAHQVTEELGHLAMGSALLEVAVLQQDDENGLALPDGRRVRAHAHGVDEVEIRLSAGPGRSARNVATAASGGELSRVMLALEVVTSSGDVPTFVFDEVDAGVGGAAALDVGARLQALAAHAQVIVVTHLAQVAAHADHHLVVRKQDDGQITSSGVVEVTDADREAELARMLGGRSDSAAARRHARELLQSACAGGTRAHGTMSDDEVTTAST